MTTDFNEHLYLFLDGEIDLRDKSIPSNAWTNYYRRDDVCATAFFYLDKPASTLPRLAGRARRVAGDMSYSALLEE